MTGRIARPMPPLVPLLLAFTAAANTHGALSTCRAADRPMGRSFVTRSVAVGRNGMAATSQPLATLAALDVLRRGGSAVDAAIAANAMLGLTEPTGSGVGGDLFAIVWDNETQQLYGLNGSGRSPKGLTLEEFKKRDLDKVPAYGPLPISVPGCVDGWFSLHGRFGRLPMQEVLGPAIHYAREGFPLTEVIAEGWKANIPARKDLPGFADTFLVDGRAPEAGEVFRNPALASTLETIARDGRDAFYRGEIARKIDIFMRAEGGFLRYEDLAAHQSDWVEPVSVNYRGYDVWELPPNGQGIAALQILQILSGYDLRSAGFGSPEHVHWFTEAKKLAFEDRARFYADPDFFQAPIAELISPEYAAKRRELIGRRSARRYDAGNPALREGDTVFLTVADKDHNMVALIQSNYRGMGSGFCPPGLGFCFQNRGELFDLDPESANAYAPGKRPFHTIIPAFVTKEGKPVMSFGVMGGDMQPQGHAQILMNLLDFDMGLQEAGDAPRIYHTGSSEPTGERMTDGGVVHLENGFPPETVRELVDRGHKIQPTSAGAYGGYQAIWYDAEKDVYTGATESRKDGFAAGY